ncbi:MAG: TonB-dependent receptor [Woeseiaceae bacterium]|nr:TonB-dependent receptor [Woeseiaceae bacterium]
MHHATLEEIVVTARKRAEPLLHSPISITSFSDADFAARKLTDISQLADYTPNMEFDFTAPISGSTNTAMVFIRGIGQSDYIPGMDPGVGIYLDGIYITRSAGSVLNLIDVERIDVLRGPQGTLFGKNTIGGAIDVKTVRPADEFEAGFDMTFGSRDRADFRGFANVPLGSSLFARAALGHFRRDGHLSRVLAGDRMGDRDELAGRLSLLWVPNDGFEASLAFDYSAADDAGTAARLLSTDVAVPTSPYPIGHPATIFAGQAYNVLIGAAGPGASSSFPFLPPLPDSAVPYDSRWLRDSAFESNATGPNYSVHHVRGVSATMSWTGAAVGVRSISGFRTTDARFGRDPDGSPLVIGETEVWVDYRQASQELQISGAAPGSRVEWLAGVYWLHENTRQRDFVPFADETFRWYDALGVPIGNFLLADGPDSVNEIESIAVFAEATLDLSARVELTTGLRRTEERRETVANSTQGGMQSVSNRFAAMKFGDTSGRAILRYRPDDSVIAYLSYSEGFRSGGFNHRFAIPPPPYVPLVEPTRFAPENVATVEAGLKTAFLRGRGQLRTAVFHSRYRNVQVLAFDLGIPRTINAAAAEVEGLELEMDFAPNAGQTINLAYAYLDARYTRLDDTIAGAFGNAISIVPLTLDSRFVNSPEHSLAFGFQSVLPLVPDDRLRWRFDARFRSEVANDAPNTPELIQDDLWLLSTSIDWRPAACGCEVSLFAENLTDETYIVSGAADSPGSGTAEAIIARPREWGLRIGYAFN